MQQEPGLLMMWGSVQRSLGRLEQGQADMHRDFRRLERRLDELRRPTVGWVKWVPWDKVFLMAISLLGALGLIKPAWVRLLSALAGG